MLVTQRQEEKGSRRASRHEISTKNQNHANRVFRQIHPETSSGKQVRTRDPGLGLGGRVPREGQREDQRRNAEGNAERV